jgi:hypothetical protein
VGGVAWHLYLAVKMNNGKLAGKLRSVWINNNNFHKATCRDVKFYSAGVVTRGRRIGSRCSTFVVNLRDHLCTYNRYLRISEEERLITNCT